MGHHMGRSLPSKALCLVFIWSTGAAMAQNETPPDLARRQLQYHQQHGIEIDGRTVSTYRTSAEILAQTAIEDADQVSLSW